MNRDQVKGTAKNAAGKVQEEIGKLANSKSQQAKGLQRQVAGKAQEKLGDAKQALKKSH